MLDDIVSELWRKENVTSGYCPRYRYTLIATLTLANLVLYVCVFSSNRYCGENEFKAFAAAIPYMFCEESLWYIIDKRDKP
jgi:cation transport regulator ChaC